MSSQENITQVESSEVSERKIAPAIVSGIIFFALGLIVTLQRPLFHDEASTWYFSAFGLDQLFSRLSQDVHPPLFFLFSWLFSASGSLFLIRVFSILCFATGTGLIVWRLSELKTASNWVIAFLFATSPFPVFCSGFARYYGMTFLIVVVICLWFEKFLRKPQAGNSWILGTVSAMLFLTNYAASILILPFVIATILIITIRQKNLTSLVVAIIPLWIAALSWAPIMFLMQMSDGFDGRGDGATMMTFIKDFVRNFSYLGYSFMNGDGLPPWNPVSWISSLLGIVAIVLAVIPALRNVKQTWKFIFPAVILLVGAGFLGSLATSGSAFVFFPARVAWLWLIWIGFVVILPACYGRLNGLLIACVGLMNILGLFGMMIQKNTTVWAYAVPNDEIVSSIEEAWNSTDQSVAFFLDEGSMIQIRYGLENSEQNPDIPINQCGDIAETILIMTQQSKPAWPPSAATGVTSRCDPIFDYELIESRPFLFENEATRSMKEKIMGREVTDSKLVLHIFKRKRDADVPAGYEPEGIEI